MWSWSSFIELDVFAHTTLDPCLLPTVFVVLPAAVFTLLRKSLVSCDFNTVQYLEIFVEISCFPIFTSGSRTSHEGFWSSAQNMTFSHSKLCGRPKRIMTASSTQWDEESKQQSRQRDVPKKKELPYKQS